MATWFWGDGPIPDSYPFETSTEMACMISSVETVYPKVTFEVRRGVRYTTARAALMIGLVVVDDHFSGVTTHFLDGKEVTFTKALRKALKRARRLS